jgi:hypothetical protein
MGGYACREFYREISRACPKARRISKPCLAEQAQFLLYFVVLIELCDEQWNYAIHGRPARCRGWSLVNGKSFSDSSSDHLIVCHRFDAITLTIS